MEILYPSFQKHFRSHENWLQWTLAITQFNYRGFAVHCVRCKGWSLHCKVLAHTHRHADKHVSAAAAARQVARNTMRGAVHKQKKKKKKASSQNQDISTNVGRLETLPATRGTSQSRAGGGARVWGLKTTASCYPRCDWLIALEGGAKQRSIAMCVVIGSLCLGAGLCYFADFDNRGVFLERNLLDKRGITVSSFWLILCYLFLCCAYFFSKFKFSNCKDWCFIYIYFWKLLRLLTIILHLWRSFIFTLYIIILFLVFIHFVLVPFSVYFVFYFCIFERLFERIFWKLKFWFALFFGWWM